MSPMSKAKVAEQDEVAVGDVEPGVVTDAELGGGAVGDAELGVVADAELGEDFGMTMGESLGNFDMAHSAKVLWTTFLSAPAGSDRPAPSAIILHFASFGQGRDCSRSRKVQSSDSVMLKSIFTSVVWRISCTSSAKKLQWELSSKLMPT